MLLREEDIPLLSDIGFYPLERRYAVPWRQEILLLKERISCFLDTGDHAP
jgi:hypothetical protein